MANQIQTIQFHNQPIITMQQDETVFVAMKPICENIGLQWEAQRQRIERDEVLNSTACMIKVVAEDGKKREMLCLPIDYLNGWLFGVDVKRVKPEIKDKLIQYKKECYQVLNDYWRKGFAGYSQVITITYDQVQELKQHLMYGAARRQIIYPELRDRLFLTFGISDYYELPANRYYDALDYIDGNYNPSGERPEPMSQDKMVFDYMWRLIGIMKYGKISDELEKIQKAMYEANEAITRLEKHKSAIYDAFTEPSKPPIGKDGYDQAYQKALNFMEEHYKLKFCHR